jgi:CHASE3 domain sensor protein
MATATPVEKKTDAAHQAALDTLAADFFEAAEAELEKMESEERERVVASIHATAESLRAKR